MYSKQQRKEINGKIRVNFRMTQEHYDLFVQRKKERNWKTSEFFERQILYFKLYFLDFEELLDLAKLFNDYGNSLNHITKKLHNQETIYLQDIKNLEEKISKIEKETNIFLEPYTKYFTIKIPKVSKPRQSSSQPKIKQPDFFITPNVEEKLRKMHQQIEKRNNIFNVNEFYTRVLLTDSYTCVNTKNIKSYQYEVNKIRNNFTQALRKLATLKKENLSPILKKQKDQLKNITQDLGKVIILAYELLSKERSFDYGSMYHQSNS